MDGRWCAYSIFQQSFYFMFNFILRWLCIFNDTYDRPTLSHHIRDGSHL